MNEKIRAHIPVTVQLLPLDDPAVEKVEAAVFYLIAVTQSLNATKMSYWVI